MGVAVQLLELFLVDRYSNACTTRVPLESHMLGDESPHTKLLHTRWRCGAYGHCDVCYCGSSESRARVSRPEWLHLRVKHIVSVVVRVV